MVTLLAIMFDNRFLTKQKSVSEDQKNPQEGERVEI
jgi:hypothetical protein